MYAKHTDTTVLSAKSVNQLSQPRIPFGVVVDDYANHFDTLAELEAELGKTIGIVSLFKQFGKSGNSDFVVSDLAYVKKAQKTVLLAWEPWDPDLGLAQKKDYLQSIITGKEDAYIRQFAKQIRSFAGPVILRFGHEMNGNWYPWGNQPESYKTAYRHIVAIFRSEKITNVSWMWSINADNVPSAPLEHVAVYYPGDDVVDLIGLDGFNFGVAKETPENEATTWRSFRDIFLPSYRFTLRYKKPIIISEVASAEIGGNKATWVKTMLQTDLPQAMPKVTAIIWFDLLKERDWRIDSSKSSLETFKEYL